MRRSTVERMARELGARVDVVRYHDGIDIQVEAPPGKVWSCTGDIHIICASQEYFWPKAHKLWTKVGEDIKMGLEDCTIEDCDYCRETRSS